MTNKFSIKAKIAFLITTLFLLTAGTAQADEDSESKAESKSVISMWFATLSGCPKCDGEKD